MRIRGGPRGNGVRPHFTGAWVSKYDGATIEVLNWEKYNPRGDSKRPTWFRVDNDLATGPGFFGLDCQTKWLWIVLLSLVSQKNGIEIVWNTPYVNSISGIDSKKQDEAIDIFVKFVRLRVTRKVTLECTHATNERTNERTNVYRAENATIPTKSVVTSVPDDDHTEGFLKTVCEAYPKRRGATGKKQALLYIARHFTTQQRRDELLAAVRRYAAECSASGKAGTEYVKQMITFVRGGSWEEWLAMPEPKKRLTLEERLIAKGENPHEHLGI